LLLDFALSNSVDRWQDIHAGQKQPCFAEVIDNMMSNTGNEVLNIDEDYVFIFS